eukprot:TRINITY_DN14117_c0_g1_i1.p1 TRINITY_DN14117_c0_g1~~TRINITY_DN14117_c0_g1_i1.p1  ORF type:complete len:295 (+),score=81.80 TRINITY_DN14117_c0_g1_i1:112-996(+)
MQAMAPAAEPARVSSSSPVICHDSSCWLHYVSAAAIVSMVPAVHYEPGSVEFFAAQGLLWGLSSYLFCHARKKAWGNKGWTHPPWLDGWAETAPAWAFEASFLVQLVNIPFAVAMGMQIFSSWDSFADAATLPLNGYRPEGSQGQDALRSTLWLEHVIFASLFGFMARDAALHYNCKDVLLAVHHVAVCIIMWCAAFVGNIPGIRLLALLTALVETGTSAYCAWVIWRCRRSYVWTMSMSNIALVVGSTFCLYNTTPDGMALNVFLYTIGWGLAVGRHVVMLQEVRKHTPSKQD